MKICLVNNLLAPWSRGGAEKIVEALAEAIRADGHEVFFISTKPVGAKSPKIQRSTHYYLSSYYHSLNKWPYLIKLIWHIFSLVNCRRIHLLKKILLKEQPDLIITNNLTGIGFGLGQLAETLKIKHFHILHDAQLLHPSGLIIYGRIGELATPLAKLYQRLARIKLGQPAVVISASEWLVKQHLKRGFFGSSAIHYLLNPADNHWSPAPKINNEPTFLFVGQIEIHKGVKLLLEAWADFINRTKAEAKLLIVGDGSLLAGLKQTKIPQITFTGKLLGNDLVKAYQEAFCLVVPSLCYEKPTVIYEAASVNIPAIASSLGGMKELLTADYLFKPEVKDLSDKLFWAYKKRHELIAPQIKLISPEKYWSEIKKYATQ